MSNRGRHNDETRGVVAPGPIDRLLDRDRDEKADILEGGADRTAARGAQRDGKWSPMMRTRSACRSPRSA